MEKIGTIMDTNKDAESRVTPGQRAAALTYLDGMLAKARRKRGLVTETVELTPALAEVLLERNPGNRAIKGGKLGIYMKDIEADRWRLNGQTITVADTGELNDGQHRCRAVVNTNRSIRTVMTFGVERDTRETLDIGSVRHPGDILKFAGHSNGLHLASLLKHVVAYENSAGDELRSFTGTNRIGIPELSQRANEADKELLEEAASFSSSHAKDVRGRMTPSMLGFSYWLLATANPTEGRAFMRRLVLQDGTGQQDPEWHLYRTLQGKATRGAKPMEIAEAVIRAYNLRRQNKVGQRSSVVKGYLPNPRR